MTDVLRRYKDELVGVLYQSNILLTLLAVSFDAKGIISPITLETVQQKGGVNGATFLLNHACNTIESKPDLLKIVFQILKRREFEDLSLIVEKMQEECSPTPDLADITPLGKDFKVCISYRKKDKQKKFVDNLCNDLDRIPHVKVWKDERVLEPGAKLTPEMLSGIESSDLFLCVLSTDYFQSEKCKMELRHALKHEKKFFPIEWVGRFSLSHEFESSLKDMLRHKYDPEAINEKAEERKCVNKVIAVIEHHAPVQKPRRENRVESEGEDAGRAVKQFGRRLSNVYSTRPDIPSNDWLWSRLSGTHFVTLALITNQSVTRDDAFTHRSLRNSEDDIPRYKMEIAYDKVFPEMLRDSRFKILVSGRPGIGKTVLLSKVCKDWAKKECLSNVVALIHVPLRELHGKCARPTLADILEIYCADQSTIHDLSRSIEHLGGEGICFALDGLDEYPNLYSPGDLITGLITNRILPQASVIVTSRPVASEKVKESMKTHVEIIGFLPTQIKEYITSYYESEQHLAKKLLAYIDTHPNVKDMCYLPLHLAMLVYFNKVSRSQNLPETESDIYHHFVSHSVIRYVVKERGGDDDVYIEKFSDMKKFLSDEEYELFQNISCLALYAKIQSRIIFSVQDIENHFPTKFTHEQLQNLKKNGLGIISSYRMYSNFGQQQFFSFQHLTFQEFLGAYHLSTLDVDHQKMMLEAHGNNPSMREVWKFFFGIIKSIDIVPLLYDKLAQLNPAKGVETLFLCRCAFETQGEDCSQELCRQLLSSRECQKMDISNVVLSSPDCSAIGFVLYNSPLEVRQLLMNYCQVGVEGIEALKAQLSKCPIEFEKISNFQIRSQLNPLGEKGATALKNILSKMPNLLELRLYGNQLTSERLAIIEPVICSMRKLCVLVLTKNDLCPASGKILCSLTMNFPNLIQFYVSYNPIGTKGLEDALPGLLKCTELKRLGLQGCNLDKNAGRLLSTIVFKLRNLEQLELYLNHLGDEGIIAMCDSLTQAPKLEQFSVTKNDMGDKGGSQLAEVVKKSYSLKQIRLYYNDVTYITRQALYKAAREREQKGLESINYAI